MSILALCKLFVRGWEEYAQLLENKFLECKGNPSFSMLNVFCVMVPTVTSELEMMTLEL